MDTDNKKTIAVYDFDLTIVARDSASCLFRHLIFKNTFRMLLASGLLPFALPFLFMGNFRRIGLSIFLWGGTVGMKQDEIDAVFRDFPQIYFSTKSGGKVYEQAIESIEEHKRAGRKILVISASPDVMVDHLVKFIFSDDIPVIGSELKRFFGGMIYASYCKREKKVAAAKAHGWPANNWQYGYTDCASDIPMLAECEFKYFINPEAKTLKKAKEAFGSGFSVLSWNPVHKDL